MLSRLPLTSEEDNAYTINNINRIQIGSLPITCEQIQDETANDPVLCKVVDYLSSGNWPNPKNITNEIKPYIINDMNYHFKTVLLCGIHEWLSRTNIEKIFWLNCIVQTQESFE